MKDANELSTDQGQEMGLLLDFTPLCRPPATLPKEQGPAETVPGRKAETDRVHEGISEGFHPAQSGRVAPKGRSPWPVRWCRPLQFRVKAAIEWEGMENWRVLSAGPDYDTTKKRPAARASSVWRRRAGSNRCIAVLQTAPLTTWVRRPARIIAGLVPISQCTP